MSDDFYNRNKCICSNINKCKQMFNDIAFTFSIGFITVKRVI